MEFKQLSYEIESVSILTWLATSAIIAVFDPGQDVLPCSNTIATGAIATACGINRLVHATHVGGIYEVIQDDCKGK